MNTNILRLIALALPLTLLLACGGGGGGGTAVAPMNMPDPMTPPTDNGGGGPTMPTMPTGPQALPTALIADPSAARNLVSGSSAPTTTAPTEIQAAFQMEAMNADILIASDAFVTNALNPDGADMSTGENITLGDFTFRSSLDNIKTGIADRFNLEGVSSQYSPIMDHRGVMLAEYLAAGRNGSDVFEYRSYGGWLTNSAFSVDMLTINDGSDDESSLLVGVSYGDRDNSSSKPTGSGPGAWNGAMIGVDKSSGDVVQGILEIRIADVSSTQIDLITLASIQNLNDGVMLAIMQWGGVKIKTNGTFSSTMNGDIDGAFYGTGGTEVGGTFNRAGIIGAFGGTRE